MRELRAREAKGEAPKPPGRPKIPPEVRAAVRARVAAQLDRQGGRTGEPAILEALREEDPAVSRMLVRQELAAEKRARRARTARVLEAQRVSHDVAARDAVWAQDATHLGREADEREVQAEVVTDRATLSTVSSSAGAPATGAEIVAALERMAEERGGLPLVWQTDNGPAYASREVQAWLEAWHVIWLRSRPHVPTDNPVAEHKNRELKEESRLGKGVVLASPAEAQARLTTATRRLDHGRRRATRGWLTARRLDAALPRADALVDRETFYRAACAARERVVSGLTDAEEIREAEQRATWATLESFGLARRVVGPRPRVRPVPTPCSAAQVLVA
jgi:transposase InsO family protein